MVITLFDLPDDGERVMIELGENNDFGIDIVNSGTEALSVLNDIDRQ